MWATEHSIETCAAPEAIWQPWSDVRSWKSWNGDVERVDVSGDFAVGSIRTIHRVDTARGGGSRVTYRMEISGPDADSTAPELGSRISGDFPDTLAALVAHAER